MIQIKATYITGPRPGNFGDKLTPIILKHYGFSVEHVSTRTPYLADAICCGSIAKLARSNTIVLGSGILTKDTFLNPEADWRWVRGPITQQQVINCGGQSPNTLGDPALLLPKIIPGHSDKKYKVGLIPHYSDYSSIKTRYPDHLIINVLDNVENIVYQINQCEKIISSSLHGIIASHAYGIPASRFELNTISGDGVKFLDYSEFCNIDIPVSSIDSPKFILPDTANTFAMEKVIHEVYHEFQKKND